jgi:Raf kinase inhibitor-like YbhB/YbcL family protein
VKLIKFSALLTFIFIGSSCSAFTTTTTTTMSATSEVNSEFMVLSPVMQDGGTLPVDYTCDGSTISPPISWSNAPSGTTNFAVLMDHQPGPEDWHWYWTLWGIDANTQELPAGSNGDAIVGTNSVNGELAYTPPCSQGPGEKAYNITVYALSDEPNLTNPSSVDRSELLDAIESITLASDTMTVTYTRS